MSGNYSPKTGHQWYCLSGADYEAAEEYYKAFKNEIPISDQDLLLLGTRLGLTFIIRVNDPMGGISDSFPETYRFENASSGRQEFYMLCPIGHGRKDGKTQFKPEHSSPVSYEKSIELDMLLADGNGELFCARTPKFYPPDFDQPASPNPTLQ